MTDSPKKKKLPRDINQRAKSVVDIATGQVEIPEESAKAKAGRKGGQKGGKARAKKLTKSQRSAIARRAAESRWNRAAE